LYYFNLYYSNFVAKLRGAKHTHISGPMQANSQIENMRGSAGFRPANRGCLKSRIKFQICGSLRSIGSSLPTSRSPPPLFESRRRCVGPCAGREELDLVRPDCFSVEELDLVLPGCFSVRRQALKVRDGGDFIMKWPFLQMELILYFSMLRRSKRFYSHLSMHMHRPRCSG
jgi:hypothetical protein